MKTGRARGGFPTKCVGTQTARRRPAQQGSKRRDFRLRRWRRGGQSRPRWAPVAGAGQERPALRKLDAARDLSTLFTFPGNRLEKLRGEGCPRCASEGTDGRTRGASVADGKRGLRLATKTHGQRNADRGYPGPAATGRNAVSGARPECWVGWRSTPSGPGEVRGVSAAC